MNQRIRMESKAIEIMAERNPSQMNTWADVPILQFAEYDRSTYIYPLSPQLVPHEFLTIQ